MIKFRAETSRNGRPLVGLGLSFRNLALLQQGRPIHVDGRELGLEFDIAIFGGETEESLLADLAEHGVTVPAKPNGGGNHGS